MIQLMFANSAGLVSRIVIVGETRGSDLMPDILRIYQREEGVSKFISLIEIDQTRYRDIAKPRGDELATICAAMTPFASNPLFCLSVCNTNNISSHSVQ